MRDGRALVTRVNTRRAPGGRALLPVVLAFAGRVVDIHEQHGRAAFGALDPVGANGLPAARQALDDEHDELAQALADLVTAVAAWEVLDPGASDEAWAGARRHAVTAARVVADDLAVHDAHEARVVASLGLTEM